MITLTDFKKFILIESRTADRFSRLERQQQQQLPLDGILLQSAHAKNMQNWILQPDR